MQVNKTHTHIHTPPALCWQINLNGNTFTNTFCIQICSRVLNLPTCIHTVCTRAHTHKQKPARKICIFGWITGLLGDQKWLPGNPVYMWGSKWRDHGTFTQERPASSGGEREKEGKSSVHVGLRSQAAEHETKRKILRLQCVINQPQISKDHFHFVPQWPAASYSAGGNTLVHWSA